MFASSFWPSNVVQPWSRRVRTVGVAVALVLSIAGFAPQASAASPVTVSKLSPTEVEQLLSGIPLKDLSTEQLTEVLAGHLSETPTGALTQALEKTIAGLAEKGGTLGQLGGSAALTSELENGCTNCR
jgi:hypothetical protein